MDRDDRTVFLKALPALDELPEADLAALAQRVTRRPLPRGTVLAREGELCDTCYQLVSGIIHQTRARPGAEERTSAFLTGGELVGDRSLRTGMPESSSAVAFTDIEVLALPRSEFEETLRVRPGMALALVRSLSLRLERMPAPALAAAQPERATGGARIIPLVAASTGSGRTTLGLNLCAAIAEVSGGRVLFMDPSMTGRGIATALGISSDADYAEALVRGAPLDVERATWKTKGGFWTLLPPRSRGASLAEPHLLSAFDALARAFDFVVVDSSSVLAGLNRAVLKSAERVLLVSGAREARQGADLKQFQRSVLAAGPVKPERLVCALNRAAVGESLPDGDWHPVPPAGELLETCAKDHSIPYRADPHGAFAQAIHRLALRLVYDHRLRVALPAHRWASEAQPEETAGRLKHFLGSRFAQVALEGAVAAGPEPSLTVQAWATQPVLSRHLEETVHFLGTIKGELALPYLCLEINGKPNLI